MKTVSSPTATPDNVVPLAAVAAGGNSPPAPPAAPAALGPKFGDIAASIDKYASRVPWWVWLGVGAGGYHYLTRNR